MVLSLQMVLLLLRQAVVACLQVLFSVERRGGLMVMLGGECVCV